jgi:putative glutamine amidotransferase
MVKKRKRRRKKTEEFRKIKGKPIIGITCEVIKTKPYYSNFDLYCDYRYLRAIMRAGGIPVLIPVNPFHKDVSKLLESIHGLVIIGGADIPPSFYGGGKSHRKLAPMYRGRTYFEINLYKEAQKKKIPVLAICYGMQLLNVIHGGTLHQDIQSEIKGARNHRSKKNPLHVVQVQPDSLVYKIFRKKSFLVHSEHHQAVKLPGKSLEITAVSEDGIPEALEGPPHTLAVQWHPERQPKDTVQTRLFRYFLKMIKSDPSLESKASSAQREKVINRELGTAAPQ